MMKSMLSLLIKLRILANKLWKL